VLHVPDAWVLEQVRVNNLHRIIGAAVVNDEKFPVVECLLENTFNGRSYAPAPVECRNDNRYAGLLAEPHGRTA